MLDTETPFLCQIICLVLSCVIYSWFEWCDSSTISQ